jgi:hypothetical protein
MQATKKALEAAEKASPSKEPDNKPEGAEN